WRGGVRPAISARRAAPAHRRGGLMLTPGEMGWLLAAVAKGDAAAFERLYEATRARLYGVGLRGGRRAGLAPDGMQDAYESLAQRRRVRRQNRHADHLDGGDRARTGARSRAQPGHDRGTDRRTGRGRRRVGSRGPPDHRAAAAAARLSRRARARASAPGAARLLPRLEPRAARRPIRDGARRRESMAAHGPAADPRVPRRMTLEQDDQELLAAEYVLGTLDAEERARAAALAAMDLGFAATVRAWERRLGELNVLVA